MKLSTFAFMAAIAISSLVPGRAISHPNPRNNYTYSFRSLGTNPNQPDCRGISPSPCGGPWKYTYNGKTCSCTGTSACDRACQQSCSSWSFTGNKNNQNFCNVNNVPELRYFAAATTRTTATSAVWYNHAQAEHDRKKNYWVIHGCDGAGVQVGDCLGGTGYIEQFGPHADYTTADGRWDGTNRYDSGYNPFPNDHYMKDHAPNVYQHPGTKILHKWYWAGMWVQGGADNKWPDQFKNWWPVMKQKGVKDIIDITAHSSDNEIFAVMYPWVCNLGSQNLGWFWNTKTLDKVFYNTDYTKCYYDNEPYDRKHWSSTSIPPVFRIYKFVFDKCHKYLKVYRIYEKTYEGGDKIQDSLGGPPDFTLSYLEAPPW